MRFPSLSVKSNVNCFLHTLSKPGFFWNQAKFCLLIFSLATISFFSGCREEKAKFPEVEDLLGKWYHTSKPETDAFSLLPNGEMLIVDAPRVQLSRRGNYERVKNTKARWHIVARSGYPSGLVSCSYEYRNEKGEMERAVDVYEIESKNGDFSLYISIGDPDERPLEPREVFAKRKSDKLPSDTNKTN